MVWYSLSVQGTFGKWSNAVDKYMGVKFIDGSGNLHYGWVRMDVQNNPAKIVIKDFAYESIPDKGIYAGSSISLGQNQIESQDDIRISAFGKTVLIEEQNTIGSTKIVVNDVSGKILHEQTTEEN